MPRPAAATRRFAAIRVAVVGDMMLDQYILGDVARISPEAPVPVVHVTGETRHAGGAANVAVNIASIGATAVIVGTTGDDPDGRRC